MGALPKHLAEAIALAEERGFKLTAEVVAHLRTMPPDAVHAAVQRMIRLAEQQTPRPLFLSKDLLEASGAELAARKEPQQPRPIAVRREEHKPRYSIVVNLTTVGRVEGTGDAFVRYFQSRYTQLAQIIATEHRIAATPLTSIRRLYEQGHQDEEGLYAVVMVREVKRRSDYTVLTVEDRESAATVIVRKEVVTPSQAYDWILPDQVLAIKLVAREQYMIAKDIRFPGLPPRLREPLKQKVYALFIGDFHFGSKLARTDLVRRLVDWINGRVVTPEEREIVENLRYIFIVGDLVDGVGIYKGQDKELAIHDVRKQYEAAAAALLWNIPQDITVFVIPGNHDATWPYLPQVPPFRELSEPIYDIKNVVVLSNPSVVEVEGRRVLLYHGQGLDAMIGRVPGSAYTQLHKCLPNLLQLILAQRHLAPVYGEATPLLPTKEDYLVIKEPPDILAVGHLHVAAVTKYQGIRCIATGAWQDASSYQRRHGIQPDVGYAIAVDLSDPLLQARVLRF